jgi:hypothetical protein
MESLVINLLTTHKNDSINFISEGNNLIQSLLENKSTKVEVDNLIKKLEDEISLLLQKQNNELQQITELYGCMYNNILPMWLNQIKRQIHDE